jgi:DNA topoisomerase-1
MAKLIIVESPGKIKTITSFLSSDYIVMASMGHIRLLDKTGKHNLGVDVEGNFEPTYSNDPAKKDVIKKLKAAAKTAEAVYLASDADLEGESISWHLKEILGVPAKKLFRITFNEITKKAIEEALKNPRQINADKVDAQETRRLLDRIVGFRLSGLALSKLNAKSAGRVQSSALKILVDRELEIKAFIPKEYFEIHLPFTKDEKDYVAKYKGTDKKKIVSIPLKADVDKIIGELTDKNYKVGEIKAKDRKMQAKAPYITSSFQQEVSGRLGYGAKKAMQVAQSLYEGVDIQGEHYGLITYMRTDSARLSDDFIKEAKVLIEKEYGKKYYSGTVNASKKSGKESVQDAHEGIRPTHLELTPEKVKPFLSSEEWRVYTLIYNRAIAALMTDANIKDTEVMIHNNQHRFGITGHEIIFDGFLKVYKEFKEDEEEDAILPSFSVGEVINNKPLKIERKETTPPGRYTEASLVKKMEELGIGRPSTYASIVETLKGRDYTEAEKKTLKPTDKGILVVQMLDKYFDTIINTTYTAQMEDKLDQIAEGKLEKLTQLKEFYDSFEPLVLKAHREVNKDKEKPQMTDKLCAKCAAPMVIRSSKFGQFYACSKFPKCKHTEKMEGAVQANATPTVAPVSTGKTCPVCNEGQLVKRIAKTGKSAGSSFYACNKFPKCKTTYNEEQYVAQFGAAPSFSDVSTDTE